MVIEHSHNIIMGCPQHFDVSYSINPWMSPDDWASNGVYYKRQAVFEWNELYDQFCALDYNVVELPAIKGLPDTVFPANAAIVLDRRALLSRFRFPERQGEEAHFLGLFNFLKDDGLLDEVVQFPEGLFQEGAGDAIWDHYRQLFWVGYGPRSMSESLDCLQEFFVTEVVPLKLVAESFYHLDTCFCLLSGGEVMFYPDAFDKDSMARIRDSFPSDQRIEATPEEAKTLCLNAVSLGRELIMSPPPPRIRDQLARWGYHIITVPLDSFNMSGGSAYCMCLRLDLESKAFALSPRAAE